MNYKVVKPNSRHLEKHINIADQITLDYAKDQMFYLEFAALDLVNAATHQFAYKLFPFEEGWKTVGEINNASYANIPLGNDQFQVKSGNLNSFWSNQIKEIDIYIKPTIWQRAWFRLVNDVCNYWHYSIDISFENTFSTSTSATSRANSK